MTLGRAREEEDITKGTGEELEFKECVWLRGRGGEERRREVEVGRGLERGGNDDGGSNEGGSKLSHTRS